MTLRLEAIKFNHHPDASDTDALNIRKNATEMVPVPEWKRGVTTGADQSIAAYAISEVSNDPNKPATIEASFSRLDAGTGTVEVRATDSPGFPPNILGTAVSGPISFGAWGESGFVSLELQAPRLAEVGVGAYTVRWSWQYRLSPNDDWVDFATTDHTIYVVLKKPNLPWKLSPYTQNNIELPWADALEWACQWAAGTKTVADTQAAMTRSINGLGPSVMEYDCDGGDSHYSKIHFDCGAFLELLDHGPHSNGRYVNCSDCATFVSSFANLLGCNLAQSQMGYTFNVNPVMLIGGNTIEPPCGSTGWLYHEVAWTGGCGRADHIFDACLHVDANINLPHQPPQPLLPIDMVFGWPGGGDYVDLLTPDTQQGQFSCNPQTQTCRHRKIMNQYSRNFIVTNQELLEQLERIHDYETWRDTNKLNTNLFLWHSLSHDFQISGLQPAKIEQVRVRETINSIQSIWQPAELEENYVLNIELYECSSRSEAQHFLLDRMGQMQLSHLLLRDEQSDIGDVVFMTKQRTFILFARANLAVLISNVGKHRVPVAEIGARFDRNFISIPATTQEYSGPTIRTFELSTEDLKRDEVIALTISASEPDDQPLSFKFFSDSGEVHLVDGQPHYTAKESGPQAIKVFAINPAGYAATRNLQFSI
jgi:hypothetical protein